MTKRKKMALETRTQVLGQTQAATSADRRYKDRVFRAVFSEKEDLLELYNALRGSDYKNPDDLEINTLENVLYLSMKNDLSFLIDGEIHLYEHQSTMNPNMPLRGLFYLADLFKKYVEDQGENLYGSRRIQLPAPYYVVFYNGLEDQPDVQVMRLSESYIGAESDIHGVSDTENGTSVGHKLESRGIKEDWSPCLEMTAIVLNVNLGHNREMMERCRKLNEYARFVSIVRTYQDTEKDLTKAINQALDECIRNNILAKFLKKNRSEVMNSLLCEYDEEKFIARERKNSYADGEAHGLAKGRTEGKAEGKAEDILELLADIGKVSPKLRRKILSQSSPELLTCWLKLAARSSTLEEFEKKIEI